MLLSLAPFIILLPSVLATCTNFTVGRRPLDDGESVLTFFTASSHTLRVSASINCSDPGAFDFSEGPPGDLQNLCNSTQCEIYTPENYQVRVNRTLNITTSDVSVADGIFNLIEGGTPFSMTGRANLNQSWVYPIGGVSSCLSEGMSGFWGFTPKLRCVDGVLSGCSTDDGDPVDGTSVRACGVAVLVNGIVDGTLSIVYGGEGDRPPPPNATLTDEDRAQSDDQLSNEAMAMRWSTAAVVVSIVAMAAEMLL